MLSFASDKAKLFANFCNNSDIDDSGISLPDFSPGTNLKLLNIFVTPKMVEKVTMKLDLSKASGTDCIPVVVLKNCELELFYILAEYVNNLILECLILECLKEPCFPDCWMVSSVVPVFKNVVDVSTAKNYLPFSPVSVVSKVFEKLTSVNVLLLFPLWITFFVFIHGFWFYFIYFR